MKKINDYVKTSTEAVRGERRTVYVCKCDYCHRLVKRDDTGVIFDRNDNRRKRLCRDCTHKFYHWEAKKLGLSSESMDKILKWTGEFKRGAL